MFRKAVIIGVGQIGASVGMNLIAKKLAKEVVGVGRSKANLREAKRRRAIQRVGAIQELPLLTDDDLVVLAVPVAAIRRLLEIMPKAPLIIDVGSTKSAIVSEARKRRLRFVGCHPIAGTEVPGAAGADKDLFRGKICLVTPSKGASPKDVALVKKLWQRLGSGVISMEPEAHDRAMAAFSHLPHVIAYSLAAQSPIASVPKSLFAGLGSFKSATRVASSSPEMWRDIFLENGRAVLAAVDRQVREFKSLRRLIARRDAAGLLRYLSRAQSKRRKITS